VAPPIRSTVVARAAVAAVLVAATVAPWLAAARADDSLEQGPALSAFAQSSGRNGNTLKWLPHRPQPGDSVRTAPVSERITRVAATSAIRAVPRPASNPMNDPFGDNKTELLTAASPGSLGSDLLEPPEPTPPGALPSPLPTEEPPKEPYVPGPPEATITRPIELEPLAAQPSVGGIECPKNPDQYFQPIGKLDADISYKQTAKPPEECPLAQKTFEPRCWAPTTFLWKSTGLCHKPLYFEEVQLERYGHTVGPLLQPIVSGAHFFLTVPVLPYQMGLTPPGECMYTLGYYRPGSCAPYTLDPIPLSARAALAEGGVMTGLVFLIP